VPLAEAEHRHGGDAVGLGRAVSVGPTVRMNRVRSVPWLRNNSPHFSPQENDGFRCALNPSYEIDRPKATPNYKRVEWAHLSPSSPGLTR
jgi:hypothetical protein